MSEHIFRAGFLFCGLGAGARGFLESRVNCDGHTARFASVGGIDNDPLACADFTKLTGSPGVVADLSAMQPHELVKAWGDAAPDVVFLSPPCKGFSGLLSKAAAEAEKYQTMNRLVLQGLFLVCEAWRKPPPLIVVENVPRIATRGAHLLAQVRSMLSTYGFRFHEANHDCGEIGGLAQRRRRFLLVARRPEAVKSFVYKPPKQRVRACGEVLGQLPLPEDPAAGALHKLPRISWLNWVRLALIPAGGDWRDLPGVVPEGKQRRSVFARYDVRGWNQEARTVAGDGTNGGYAVVDPRVGLDHEPRRGALGVIDWTDPSCTVRGRADVRTGPAAVVDPRLGPKEGDWHHGVCGVQPWDQPAGTVTGGAAVTTGRFSVADPRIADMNKIGWGSYQNQCVVLGWDDPARTITSATRVCSGAPSIADPRAFAGGYGVLDWEKPSGVVTGELYPSTGRGSVADPRIGAGAVHGPNAHWNKYKVADWTAPASTVIGATRPGSGAACVVDPRLGCEQRSGSYGVQSWEEPAATVLGSAGMDNSRSSIADPRVAPPWPASYRIYTLAEALELAQGRALPPAGVVPIIASPHDGMWHRPMTTLELAALQGLPAMVDGEPLMLAGRSVARWRERVGNAVPVQAATVIGNALLTALVADATGSVMLGSSNVWVRPDLDALRAAPPDAVSAA